ncbi:MAG: DUF1549 domain-containing protein [Planctomycetales bacterium]|nr:DUF1549 domain-containing protein [Planctomycetales bacterium]
MRCCHCALMLAALVFVERNLAKEPASNVLQDPTQVSFYRHVAPLLTRCGCNVASCHGAADGQGGLKLSLFGYDAAADLQALTDADAGRIEFSNPSNSLLLQKPSLQVSHDGGQRFSVDSLEFRTIQRWVEQGCRAGQVAHPEALELVLAEPILDTLTPVTDFRVLAHFAGGETEDVTPFASNQVLDEAVARIGENAQIHTTAPGSTAIVSTYAGRSTHASIWISNGVADRNSRAQPGIDGFIDHKLAILAVTGAPQCDDSTFLRRVFQTTIGQLPSADSVRSFLADNNPDKRAAVIDRLLADPLHHSMWANRFCEITGSRDNGTERQPVDPQIERMWHAWLTVQFAQDIPYHDLVRSIVTATTRQGQSATSFVEQRIQHAGHAADEAVQDYSSRESFDLFFRRPSQNDAIELETIAERVSAAFMGIRIECARCHKHPFDRWTQNDHKSLMNVFSPVRFGMSTELRTAILQALERQRERSKLGLPAQRIPRTLEVYETLAYRDQEDAFTGEFLAAKPLGGPELVGQDRRSDFVDWLTQPGNPYFAPNIVNRVWAFYFGHGLVEPLDAFSASNPATHPELLAWLSRQFVEHGFSIRWLERQILMSQAWQRSPQSGSFQPNAGKNYARWQVRLLPADALVDCLSAAIGDQGRSAVQTPYVQHDDPLIQSYFDVFQRPQRVMACDCEVNLPPSLRQAMLLMSDASLETRILQGRVHELVTSHEDTDELVIEELFLAALSRAPEPNELEFSLAILADTTDRSSALTDILWGLINTREFVTIH